MQKAIEFSDLSMEFTSSEEPARRMRLCRNSKKCHSERM